MKRFWKIGLPLMLVFVLLLSACGDSQTPDDTDNGEVDVEDNGEDTGDNG